MRRIALAAAAVLFACAEAEVRDPNVLLITVDTLRSDRLSAYGFEDHETPGIDGLAAGGALFENAFTDAPWTTPAMSTVMTGTYPTRHGFRSTNAHRLGPENETLAELLRARGYATAAFVGSFPLDSIYQLDQGFDVYDDEFTLPIWKYPGLDPEHVESEFKDRPEAQRMFALKKAVNDSRRSDADVTDAALAWLDTRPGKPFFLWVHYFGPHTKPDWTIPEEHRFRKQYAEYDPDVLEVDRAVGRLLARFDERPLRNRTVVVFHADHAESLGEQGYIGHGMLLNDATMRIPLIVRYPPRIPAGVRSEALVRNVDILPTVLDIVRAPAPEDLGGASLLPLVEDAGRWGAQPDPPPERVAYMETYYTAHVAFAPPVRTPDGRTFALGRVHRAVREGRYQLVRTEPHPLLDVSDALWEDAPPEALAAARREVLIDTTDEGADPRDLSDEQPEIAARLRALLDAQLAQDRGEALALPIDDETRLRLESLGYGGASDPEPTPTRRPPRPSAAGAP
jgi:arylsulfatase A-like enzyme